MTADTLTDALLYALDKTGGAQDPVAIINATGAEAIDAARISGDACRGLPLALEGAYKTILVRATRQVAQTLGLVALAADHAAPDARIYVAQENAHGAGGLEKQLARGFPDLTSVVKFKCRILVLEAGDAQADMLARWREGAALRKVKHNRGEFWSVPGVFSWDRPDPGSLLLLSHLPKAMPGIIVDLGCGNGLLSAALAKKDGAAEIYAIDADAGAVESCKRNLDERGTPVPVHVLWRDATADAADLPPMDFVVTNPPFHTQQEEDRALGRKFLISAIRMLKKGGTLYLVANRHMPYEDVLANAASRVTLLADTGGFKIIEAVK